MKIGLMALAALAFAGGGQIWRREMIASRALATQSHASAARASQTRDARI